ncbi:hypothetical protein TSAR_005281 [Trichomalopsis sarcophagae]|uniref:Uncharacterized protein n=1 Tax=Trichomalopsis sarcophagae TaxID=543379 RepID=A0A232EZ66_9HYME|nr:hypothetical protein TSAR_005281 [Trichomalopsis sarcophagae]
MRKLPVDSRAPGSEKTPFTVLLQPIEILAYKVRKLRRSRRVEPQPIPIDHRDDEAGLEDEGDEEYEDEEEEEEEEEEMARQRQIYETAFDCKVSRSDDDLDDLDRITNHPLLISQVSTFISKLLFSDSRLTRASL